MILLFVVSISWRSRARLRRRTLTQDLGAAVKDKNKNYRGKPGIPFNAPNPRIIFASPPFFICFIIVCT